jgi:hypothetical protein
MTRKLYISSLLLFIVGLVFAITMTSGDLFLYFGKLVGIASHYIGGDYTAVSSVGESVGVTKMSSGDYEILPTVSQVENKLETDLSKAHCYPNPYKPNSGLGHTKITFSRLTSHTKLKVFNIVGELVYEKEEDTPSGELSWDVVNNNGEKLASGVYIYLITDNSGNKAKGKFAVIK